MRVNKYYIISVFILLASCIDPYTPDIDEMQNLMVVDGYVTDEPGEHVIKLSRSSSFKERSNIPMEGCVVQVENNEGIAVGFNEDKPGVYRGWLDGEFLGINKAYRIYIKTPKGDEYLSDFDTLLPCPDIDSLYYFFEDRASENLYRDYKGIRFHVDVEGKPGEAENYLWKLEETYEYHAEYIITYYWDGQKVHEMMPPIDSLYTCYKTERPSRLYTTSTRNLSTNELKAFPLNYVSNQTLKLKEKYSLLLSQYSLSDDAYEYWDNLSAQIGESGGLYEKQPSGVAGNIRNVNNAEEQVLGYFYASQIKKKRIMIEEDFPFPFPLHCAIDTVNLADYIFIPLYLTSFDEKGRGGPYGGGGSFSCFDCRALGGVLKKPDYWDDDEYLY